ncbi:hypothetical protein F5B22DRAFT_16949 [Xylaria bambusicola]|uniref:uncharacterized protein n=1 Tax=Xylaria bambusicola TaxID=326684 RepID=UPI0020082567|nr:uncharacterized protein F5B22DRAFT_16949 [Xylaria bambusicola]KAI0528043.1 hypothetical protein F5B22DRAFT_16949 [Xylaria bambusicola]
MKVPTTILYGLIAATGVLAQDNDLPTLIADGPFALRVKGRCNSSIDGYLRAVDVWSFDTPQAVLHYDPTSAPAADNSSYRFYFNHTGNTQSADGYELGFMASDITVGEPNGVGLMGKAASLQYRPNTNVAVAAFGAYATTVDYTGFGKDGKGFLNYYSNDANTVPEQPANVSLSINYYDGWAICWQTYFATTGPTLSWITTGKPHNPTCERVDLLKAEL